MPKIKPYVPLHAAADARSSSQIPRLVSVRRVLCVAGLAVTFAFGSTPLAHADGFEIPDGSWSPDIEVDIDGNPIETPALPEPEPEPAPQPDPTPDPIPEPEPQPGEGNSGANVPDSGSNVPDYGDIYGDTSADSIGSGAGAFYDPSAEAQTVQESDVPQDVSSAAIPVPVFGGFDAENRAISGTATPGNFIQAVDVWGTVVAQSPVNDDGTFWIQLPEGYDLASVSLVVVNGDGVWMSGTLTGDAMVDSVARQERSAVLEQVGAATSSLAKGFTGSLNITPVGAFVDMPEDESLPILPYAVGAGSALVAVAAVGGAVYAFRKVAGARDAYEEEPVFAEVAPVAENRPTVHTGSAPFHDDGLDDLERLALGLNAGRVDAPSQRIESHTSCATAAPFRGASPDDTFGWVVRTDGASSEGGRHADGGQPAGAQTTLGDIRIDFDGTRPPAVGFQTGDSPETTIPCPSVLAPIDPETFAATARVLAAGSGRVHRITTSTCDLDLSGLDLFDESKTPASPQPSADPMIDNGDWYEIALRELAEPPYAPEATAGLGCPTEGYCTLAKTKSDARIAEKAVAPGATAYVAPVIGPSSISPQDVERHRALLDQAQTPQAAAMRERDMAFLGQKRRTAAQTPSEPMQASDHENTTGFAPGVACLVSKDGVPIIARGSGGQTPGPARRPWTVGDASVQHSQPKARQTRICHVPDFEREVTDIAPIASDTTSDSETVGSSRPSEVFSPGASVAAAYAAAVYGRIAQDGTIPAKGENEALGFVGEETTEISIGMHATCRQLTSEFVPVVDEWAERDHDDDYDYRTETMLSPAYINYMVQDEFEHRHDTPAQRNAALGRMRIINGAACPPVSVKEGVARHRYMA